MSMKFCGLTCAIMAAGATAGFSQTINWTNTAGGVWQDAGNWNPNTVPSAEAMIAKFGPSGAYTVTLTDNAAAERFDGAVGAFDLTFDLNGFTFNSLVIKTNTVTAQEGLVLAYGSTQPAAANLTIKSSQPGGIFNVNRIRTTSLKRPANLTLTGSNLFVNLDGTAGDIYFNTSGDGTFTVSEGARLTAGRACLFGANGGSENPNATWRITDQGTTVTVTSASGVYVGKYNVNMPTMIVSNGAACHFWGATRIAVGADSIFNSNANGRVIVTGAGSVLSNQNFYIADLAGNGTLTKSGYSGTAGGFLVVENGGKVQTSGLSMGIGAGAGTAGSKFTNSCAYGEIIVRDAGSVFTGGLTPQVGRASQGAVYVLNGGRYLIASGADIELARASNSTYTNINAYALLVVSNAGSYAEGRAVFVGGNTNPDYGYGDVIVAVNGHLKTLSATAGITLRPRSGLTVSDALVESATLVLQTNTTLRIGLGARDHADAYIKLVNALSISADVNLEIEVLDTFSAQANEFITLTTQGSRAGGFSNVSNGDVIEAGNYRFQYIEATGTNSLRVMPPRGTLIRVH